MHDAHRIRNLIHRVDPYEGFDVGGRTPDLQGWGSQAPIFEEVISQVRPSLILEVGTWKGASAIHMATLCKKHGLHETRIVCVDTWLGALEFWLNHEDADRYGSLRLRNGYPSVYETFLANVVLSGHQDMIVPFPVPSGLAARFFQIHGVQFPLIYIDASHEYEDVRSDLDHFWKCVAPGGRMFGDDFSVYWPGVVRAVMEFSERVHVPYTHGDSKWQISRPQ